MTAEPLTENQSVLACLRALHPNRRLTMGEALRVAERQAQRLLQLAGVQEAPVSMDLIASLPRIRVEYEPRMPAVTFGSADWDSYHGHWVIALNPTQPDTRTRLTTGHEFKHILDHDRPPIHDTRLTAGGKSRAEQVADYFAGCLLMPKALLTRAWYDGVQRIDDLAALFDVSREAMTVRLNQLGLLETPRHAEPYNDYQPRALALNRRRALSPGSSR